MFVPKLRTNANVFRKSGKDAFWTGIPDTYEAVVFVELNKYNRVYICVLCVLNALSYGTIMC